MSNCGLARQLAGRTFYVHVNPLLITSHFSKSINTLLRDFQPIANADFRPNRCLEFFEIFKCPYRHSARNSF